MSLPDYYWHSALPFLQRCFYINTFLKSVKALQEAGCAFTQKEKMLISPFPCQPAALLNQINEYINLIFNDEQFDFTSQLFSKLQFRCSYSYLLMCYSIENDLLSNSSTFEKCVKFVLFAVICCFSLVFLAYRFSSML